MDYEIMYEQAIKRAKAMIPVAANHEEIYNSVITIFPELAESEDERIRKELIEQVVNIAPKNDEVDSECNVLPTYQKRIDKYIAWLEKQGEQKMCKDEHNPVWSEEDDRMMNDTLAVVDWYAGKHRNISVKVSNWLKFLKFRLLSPSMREFDKEEGSIIDHLIAICDDAMCYKTFAGCSKKDIEKYKSFLTNLKFGINPQPQNAWKPSEEQMEALEKECIAHSNYELCRLLEQLKKL